MSKRVDDLVWEYSSDLIRLGVEVGERLGCGGQGCVYGTTSHGRVAKITLDANEAQVARWIFKLGKKAEPSLPRIFAVAYADPLYVIIREDLDDYRPDDERTLTSAIEDLEQGGKVATWNHELSASDRAMLGAVAKLIVWGKKHSVVMRDLAPENWGMTVDGFVALRDIGELQLR